MKISDEEVDAAYLALRDGTAYKGYLTIETVRSALEAALKARYQETYRKAFGLDRAGEGG